VSILWEVYSFADDRAGHRFIELLKAKARLGVEVRMIVDHIGSRLLPAKTLDELRLSGVEVLFYNRVRFQLNIARSFVRLWQRNHRKVLIIDDETAFIGGVNVSFLATEWADLHVKLVGRELVAPLLYDFAATYRTLHNHPLVGRFGFVKKERVVVPWANDQISFVSLSPLNPLRVNRAAIRPASKRPRRSCSAWACRSAACRCSTRRSCVSSGMGRA
jgi:phosphatidylserine/phosphatidylglycerophosphate/cardiolipin synthase-like enzyme